MQKQMVKVKKMKSPGTNSVGPHIRAFIGSGRKRSSMFFMRLDTGADTSIVPEFAVNEIKPKLYLEPKNIMLANGKFEDAKTISCKIGIEGVEEVFEPTEGVAIINKRFGFLGLDILNEFTLLLENGRGMLAKFRKGDDDGT